MRLTHFRDFTRALQHTNMIFLMFIFFAYEVTSIESRLDIYTTVPSNVAVVAGKPLILECGTENASQIHWYFQASNTSAANLLIYNGEAISNRPFARDFSVDSSNAERRDLVAKEAKFEHAGVYDCALVISTTHSFANEIHSKSQVIVLASDPRCSSNLTDPDDSASENDTVLIRCDLKYSGGWFPTMHWFKKIHTCNRSHSLESALTESSYIQSASSFVIMQVNSSDNGAVIICKTYFVSSDQVTTNASNIPDYVHHWNVTLNVEYGPRNIVVQHFQSSYNASSSLLCKADGNPVPEYTWEDIMATGTIANGQILVISKDVNENDVQYTYKCTAQNKVRSRIMEDSILFTVRIKGTYVVRNVTVIIGILCILLMVLVFYLSRTYIKDWCAHVELVFRRGEDNSEPDVVPGVQGIDEDNDNPARDAPPCNGYMDLAELAAGNAQVPDWRNPTAQSHHEIRENDADDMDRRVQPVYAEVNKVNRLHKEPEFGKQKARKFGEEVERLNNRYYGADGTEYMEVNALLQKPKPESTRQASVLESVEYASIDHRLTLHPPPALPQLD